MVVQFSSNTDLELPFDFSPTAFDVRVNNNNNEPEQIKKYIFEFAFRENYRKNFIWCPKRLFG